MLLAKSLLMCHSFLLELRREGLLFYVRQWAIRIVINFNLLSTMIFMVIGIINLGSFRLSFRQG